MTRYRWADWAQHYNRAVWDVVVAWPDGTSEKMRAPDRSELPALVDELRTRGAVSLSPQQRNGGPKMRAAQRVEAQVLELLPRQRIEVLQLNQALPKLNQALPPQPQTMTTHDDDDELDHYDDDDDVTGDPAVEAARRQAAIAEATARAAQARATQAEHDRRRAEAEAATRQFSAPSANGNMLAELARLIVENQRAADERTERLLAATRQFSAPSANGNMLAELARMIVENQRAADERTERLLAALAPARDHRRPLEELRETLGLVASVRELMQQDPAPALDGDGTAATLREVRAMLPEILSAFRRPPPAPTPAARPPQPRLVEAPKTPAVVAPAPDVGADEKRARVREFVGRIVREYLADADPAAAADALADLVGGLPGSVRAGLDAGDWPAAYRAAREHLAGDEQQQLDALTADAAVDSWLRRWCSELAVVEDAAPGAIAR